MVNRAGSEDPDTRKGLTLSWLDYVRKTDRELLKLCRVDTFRGSGRGGQKRNKTSNAIRLTLFKIAVTATASRSKTQNITSAINKLRLAIALDSSAEFHRDKNTLGFPEEIQPYLSGNTIRIRSQNPIFPIFIGCLLDHFIKHEGVWKLVAAQFGVSNSQMRRFVEKHPSLHMAVEKIKKGLAENRTEMPVLTDGKVP
jgi:hypothetical protein